MIINVGCEDGIDGSIIVIVGGGIEFYMYEWRVEGSMVIIFIDLSISNLVLNIYIVIIRDVMGVMIVCNYEIEIQFDYFVLVEILDQFSCFDVVDGVILVEVLNNGVFISFIYEFELNGVIVGFNMIGLFENFSVGDYIIYVMDNFGCVDIIMVSIVVFELVVLLV